MRGDQLSRQWRILKQIEASRNGLTAAEIAKAGSISLRTAYRDLYDLQLAGFPLYAEKGKNGRQWKFVDNRQFEVPKLFTFTELMSLHLSKDLFQVFKGTVFFESLESVLNKARTKLPTQTLTYLNRIQSTFHMGKKPYKDYSRFREIINTANQAAMECRCIEMLYLPLQRKRETLRKIDPYRIWFFEGSIYIIGLCHLRNEIRTFVLDRIKLMKLTDEKFQIPSDFDLDEYMQYSFKVMHDDLYTVKVRISPAWARYVNEKIWHESQSTRKMPDKSLEITFEVAGLEEIKQWVMGLGPEAYVIKPEKLKKMIKEDLRKTLKQYEKVISIYEKLSARKAKRIMSETQGSSNPVA